MTVAALASTECALLVTPSTAGVATAYTLSMAAGKGCKFTTSVATTAIKFTYSASDLVAAYPKLNAVANANVDPLGTKDLYY